MQTEAAVNHHLAFPTIVGPALRLATRTGRPRATSPLVSACGSDSRSITTPERTNKAEGPEPTSRRYEPGTSRTDRRSSERAAAQRYLSVVAAEARRLGGRLAAPGRCPRAGTPDAPAVSHEVEGGALRPTRASVRWGAELLTRSRAGAGDGAFPRLDQDLKTNGLSQIAQTSRVRAVSRGTVRDRSEQPPDRLGIRTIVAIVRAANPLTFIHPRAGKDKTLVRS